MRITVEAEDIRAGTRQKTTSCPVALALRRRFPDSHVYVLFRLATVGGLQYRMSDEAKYSIVAFDSGLTIEPFSFELTLIE